MILSKDAKGDIQFWKMNMDHLLNKPYVNKVTVRNKLGEKIVNLEQMRNVSVIAEKCYQILSLLLLPSHIYKILKVYTTL